MDGRSVAQERGSYDFGDSSSDGDEPDHTIRAVLRSDGPRKYQRKESPTRLSPFEGYVRGRWEGTALSGVRILEEIRGMGYSGSDKRCDAFYRGLGAIVDERPG